MKASNIIPEQHEGKASDLTETHTAATEEEAAAVFERAAKRLLMPGTWHGLAGMLSGSFLLTDEHQTVLDRPACEDDLIRIDVTGPGTRAGDGYDWVRIDRVQENIDREHGSIWTAMRVEPCPPPGSEKTESAHFFKPGASSTFIIEHAGNMVTASYHGRNEVINTDTSLTIDNIRNAVMGSAAVAGASKWQWSALLKGLLGE